MMKKYNKPEIVALALDTVDVIETSGEKVAAAAINSEFTGDAAVAKVKSIETQITNMSSTWSW